MKTKAIKTSSVKGTKFIAGTEYTYDIGVMETSGNRDGWFAFIETKNGTVTVSEKRFKTIFGKELI